MHNFANVRRNRVHALHIWANFSCLVCMERVGFPTEMTVAWFLCPTSTLTSHNLCLSLKGIVGLFEICPKGPNTWNWEKNLTKCLLDWWNFQKMFGLKCHYMKLQLVCGVVLVQLILLGTYCLWDHACKPACIAFWHNFQADVWFWENVCLFPERQCRGSLQTVLNTVFFVTE